MRPITLQQPVATMRGTSCLPRRAAPFVTAASALSLGAAVPFALHAQSPATPVSIRSLRFHAATLGGRDTRPFAARFRADSLEAVAIVLDLAHGVPEPRQATVSCEVVDPSGRAMETYASRLADRRATLVMPVSIPAGAASSRRTGRVGWYQAGRWRVGRYRVACQVEESVLAEDFEVVAPSGPVAAPRHTHTRVGDRTLPERLRSAVARGSEAALVSGSLHAASDPGGNARDECLENWATSTLAPVGRPPPTATYADLESEHYFEHYLEMWEASVEWACQYNPLKARDGDTATAWVEGVDGHGVGEVLVVDGIDPAAPVEIWAGYGRSPTLHAANSRPREVRAYVLEANEVYDDEIPIGYSRSYRHIRVAAVATVSLEDLNGYQALGEAPLCPSCDRSKHHLLALEILAVYPGSRWADLCITEVRNREGAAPSRD